MNIGSVKASLSLFRIRTAEALQYRMAGLAGASVGIFWALIEIVVFTVFYSFADKKDMEIALSLPQMISFVWLNQVLWAFLRFNIDDGLRTAITNGNIGVELCRPIDLYFLWYARTAAGCVGGAWWRAVITLAVGALIPGAYGLSAPASAAGFALFLCSTVSAVLLSVSFLMVVTAVRLGITWGEGPSYILLMIGAVFSGGYLPLQLWPDTLQKVLLYQPFAGLLDIPIRLYIGTMAPRDAASAIALQLGWMVVFVLLGRLVMRYRLRNIIVQGG